MYVLYMYAHIHVCIIHVRIHTYICTHTYAPIHTHPQYIYTTSTAYPRDNSPGVRCNPPGRVSAHVAFRGGGHAVFCFFYTSRDVSLHMLPSVGEVMCLCLCLCLCPCPCPCPCVCVTVHSHINPLKLVVATFRFTQKQLVIDTIT